MKALEEQFGDKLTVQQRRELANQLIENTFNSTKPSQPDPMASDQKNSSGSGMTPLMFVLRAPGKLVSSNGDYDEFNDEVYWALFPEAASLQPVVLTAVYEINK